MANMKELSKRVDMLSDQMYELQKKAKVMQKSAEKKIMQHPLESVGAAFGLGALFGMIISFFMRRK